jgi:hypothetical protein
MNNESNQNQKSPKANFARARNVAKAKSDATSTKSVPHNARIGAFQRLIAPSGVTPDQGCLAIIIGTTLLLGSRGFWLYYYYNHAQEFQLEGRQGPPPARLERERQQARKNRINQ